MPAPTPAPLYEDFATRFREEHRVVRDLLLDLVAAFEARDPVRARGVLAELARVTGPHFRYEEEALYPALVHVFGADYVEKLLADHDLAIGSVGQLSELAARDTLDQAEAEEGVRLTRGILPHVSDCEGLTIVAELFSQDQLETVLAVRRKARAEGLGLLTWAVCTRTRTWPS
jgi:hypothetical protein